MSPSCSNSIGAAATCAGSSRRKERAAPSSRCGPTSTASTSRWAPPAGTSASRCCSDCSPINRWDASPAPPPCSSAAGRDCMPTTKNCSASRPQAGAEHASLQRYGHRLLARYRAVLPADRLHRVRATAPATGGGGVHSPRLPQLLPGGALARQAARRGLAAGAGAVATQRVDLRWLRLRSRFGGHRSPRRGRWPAGVGLGGGHARALGTLVLFLAPPARRARKRLTAH